MNITVVVVKDCDLSKPISAWLDPENARQNCITLNEAGIDAKMMTVTVSDSKEQSKFSSILDAVGEWISENPFLFFLLMVVLLGAFT
jgi:hypothetical protein